MSTWYAESPTRVIEDATGTSTCVYEWRDGSWWGHVERQDGTVLAGPNQLRVGELSGEYMIGLLGRLTGTWPADWEVPA